MIKVNSDTVLDSRFPDGTPLLTSYAKSSGDFRVMITWKYESDSEMFRLYSIVRDLQNKGVSDIVLVMPYLPNARMDRVHDDSDVFTLKYFAEYINSMNFTSVYVLDAHSDVSLGLIDRCKNIAPVDCINRVLDLLGFDEEKDFIVYPDAGCKKRLESKIKFPSVFGDKHRDWKTGKILCTDIFGDNLDKLKGARVLFVDDICAYGGTAKFTLEKLKQLGVSECYCYFTHVEDSIFGKPDWEKTGDGKPTLLLSGLVDGIYLTDSLMSEERLYNREDFRDTYFRVIQIESFIYKHIK